MDNSTLQDLIDQIGNLKVKMYQVELERDVFKDKVSNLLLKLDEMSMVKTQNELLREKNQDLEIQVSKLKQQINTHLQQKCQKMEDKLLNDSNDSQYNSANDKSTQKPLSSSMSSTSSPPIIQQPKIVRRSSYTKPHHNTCALYIGNLTNQIDKEDLMKFFEKFGAVMYFTIPAKSIKHPSGLHYGFMKFRDSKTVDKILAKSKTYKIKGIEVMVSPAQDKF